ncbi:MAG: hypothetical protein ACK5N0_04585, partial [Synechococcaceae cyanobacterium]
SPHWLWELAESFDVRPVGALLRRHVPAHATVLMTFPGGRPSLDWYCHCAVLPANPALLADLQAKGTAAVLLLDGPSRRRWFAEAPVLGEAEGFSLVVSQARASGAADLKPPAAAAEQNGPAAQQTPGAAAQRNGAAVQKN